MDDAKPKVRLSERVLIQKVANEAVLLDLENEHYYGLNEVGARIWELIKAGQDTDQITQAITIAFDIDPATAKQDVEAFIEHLMANRLIVPDETQR